MAPKFELANSAAVTLLALLSFLVAPAEAYDAGDALALLLAAVVSALGLCVLLGWYARRRDGQM